MQRNCNDTFKFLLKKKKAWFKLEYGVEISDKSKPSLIYLLGTLIVTSAFLQKLTAEIEKLHRNLFHLTDIVINTQLQIVYTVIRILK